MAVATDLFTGWETWTELQYVPMPLEEFLELDPPENLKIEWADGMAILMPPARIVHGGVQFLVANILHRDLSDVRVITNPGLRLVGSRREPDIAVFAQITDWNAVYSKDVPIIAVEILSSSTRRNDLVAKPPEYAAQGIDQYWLVDPQIRTVAVWALASRTHDMPRTWHTIATLDIANPAIAVTVGSHGTVHLRRDEIFPA